ncbi:DUF2790 domain-containing protein [Pseudomonas sp. CF161]|uniref:DUF2790 domain-containing protein n=1 Tax=Pseudomonas sp. CF161 TaxID=911241 RepID=UPI0003552DE9|nr:DUF2790 domain-containing protein [Pseudomonas sp. CF161]EPL07172.1 hypothetical protein CF161_18229 [Pseudomonas sp. CF161]
MNARILLIGATLALTGVTGLAQADTTPTHAVPYHYGMPLHVAKVVSMTEPTTLECKVVTADMKFIDNAGKLEDISYSKLSEACSDQN